MARSDLLCVPQLIAAAALTLCACREPPVVPGAQAETRVPVSPRASGFSGADSGAGEQGTARVSAKNPLGVPLHPEPGSNRVSGRLADGSEVRVLKRTDDGRWYQVEAPQGSSGWITRRYLEPSGRGDAAIVPGASARPPMLELSADSPWAALEGCRSALAAGRRASRAPGSARIATWNLRWFPDGGPGRRPKPNNEQATDVEWLACAIAWLDVDVVVLQEIKLHPEARATIVRLRTLLDRETRGRWQAEFDRCPNESGQHVGFLFDGRRVIAQKWTTYPSLNPHGEPCKDQLRPGFGGYFRFQGGFDTHLIAAHLKSGGERRALMLREKSFEGVAAALAAARALVADDDVLLVGDLNTMGCPECSPPLSAADELTRIERLLNTGMPLLRRVEADGSCSEYFQGQGVLLDHFLVTPGLRELPQKTRARLSGYCAETGCRVIAAQQMPRAHQRLSDHCPLVLELVDQDLD